MTLSQRPAPDEASAFSYWSRRLDARPPALELPGGVLRGRTTAKRARSTARMPLELSRAFRELLRAEGIAPLDGWLALWAALLHRTTRQDDLLVGLREDGRLAALRFAFDDRPTFR